MRAVFGSESGPKLALAEFQRDSRQIDSKSGRVAQLASDDRAHDTKIRELYRLAFAREPVDEEIAIARHTLTSVARIRSEPMKTWSGP